MQVEHESMFILGFIISKHTHYSHTDNHFTFRSMTVNFIQWCVFFFLLFSARNTVSCLGLRLHWCSERNLFTAYVSARTTEQVMWRGEDPHEWMVGASVARNEREKTKVASREMERKSEVKGGAHRGSERVSGRCTRHTDEKRTNIYLENVT